MGFTITSTNAEYRYRAYDMKGPQQKNRILIPAHHGLGRSLLVFSRPNAESYRRLSSYLLKKKTCIQVEMIKGTSIGSTFASYAASSVVHERSDSLTLDMNS